MKFYLHKRIYHETVESGQSLMGIEHVSRSGKVYFLHVKTGKSGRPTFYFSMDAGGSRADVVPEGYEIHENVGGQVFLRRIPKKLITNEELKMARTALTAHAEEWRYKIEVKKNMIVVYEADGHDSWSGVLASWVGPVKEKQFRIQHASYLAVLRFILADPGQRHFAAERFCFRGSIDDWIGLGPPATLSVLIKKYVKHLGKESFYELF